MEIKTIIEGGAMKMGQWPNYRNPTPNEAYAFVQAGEAVKLYTPCGEALFVTKNGCFGATQYANGVPQTPPVKLENARTWYANAKMRNTHLDTENVPETINAYINR